MEEVMGTNGMNAFLRLARRTNISANCLRIIMESGGDFADFSMVYSAYNVMYGTKGGRLPSMDH